MDGSFWEQHIAAAPHVKRQGLPPERRPPRPEPLFCTACKILKKRRADFEQHLATATHEARAALLACGPNLMNATFSSVAHDKALFQETSIHANQGSAQGGGRHARRGRGQKKRRLVFKGNFVAGTPRSVYSSIPYKRKLKDHPINVAVTIEGSEEERLEQIQALLPIHLDLSTYPKHWHTLLHVEEEQMIRDIETYDLSDVELRQQGRTFYPGTGKTVTIVEAIHQLVYRDPNVHILACAPSNSAADLIAERLTGLGSSRLFRLNAPFRSVRDLPDVLAPYSCVDTSGRFSVVSKKALANYNVVVCTCISAGIPWGMRMRRGHFSYVFIDEAGQAMEPEAIVSINTISGGNTNLILSGDPLQLGPIIRSGVGRSLGFGVSFLERVMQRDIYQEERWRGVTVVKLVKNFRSHAAILEFPNSEFYGGKLEVCGNPDVINRFVGSPILPNPVFPVMFHGVAGSDGRENDSPSYFNEDEIAVVKDLVERILTDDAHPAAPNEIGVIAPYRARSSELRRGLRGRFSGLKVGSVEEYQGQERDVIILTTVRTDRERVTYDLRHTLGFLVNPRRLNVAITRPKGLLIIVGDPIVLGLDPLWRKFLNHIHVNGG
ncbi:hypothetical protein FRB95_002542 [Tulasnella sp. JGI-2019a]|nr:hypothetical protein FRB95_002542 [Tulasnella sp. JGI-2019a]